MITTPKEEKDSLPEYQLILRAYTLKENDCDLLWTSPSVKKYIRRNFENEKSEHIKEMIAILFSYIINVDPNIDEDLPLNFSLKKCASKIGYKNYLITPEKKNILMVFKNCSFQVEDSSSALELVNRLIQESKMGGIPPS